jgi:hypothetical protein
MPIPVPTSSEPMTEESAKGMLGMFILLNILYLISLIICHVIYFKEKREHEKRWANSKGTKYPFSKSYFTFIFIDGADLIFCQIVNWISGIVNIAFAFLYISFLIAQML